MCVENETRAKREREGRQENMAGKSERTREKILESAYALFAKRGFKQVTMKDVCEATGMSRGGLYSHFSGTDLLFEAVLEKIAEKEAMDFYAEIEKGTPATDILEGALALMEDEMEHPEESLSLAMTEYAETVDSVAMVKFYRNWEKKWTSLVRYGIGRGEFCDVEGNEIVNMILFSYQGVRAWSRIIPLETPTFRAITEHIRKQLYKRSDARGTFE